MFHKSFQFQFCESKTQGPHAQTSLQDHDTITLHKRLRCQWCHFIPRPSFWPPLSLTCFSLSFILYFIAFPLSPFLVWNDWMLLTLSGSYMFLSLLTLGRRTLPEASSSNSLMAWWWRRYQQKFSAMRSCQTLCLTKNTSQVWNRNSLQDSQIAHSCATVFQH